MDGCFIAACTVEVRPRCPGTLARCDPSTVPWSVPPHGSEPAGIMTLRGERVRLVPPCHRGGSRSLRWHASAHLCSWLWPWPTARARTDSRIPFSGGSGLLPRPALGQTSLSCSSFLRLGLPSSSRLSLAQPEGVFPGTRLRRDCHCRVRHKRARRQAAGPAELLRRAHLPFWKRDRGERDDTGHVSRALPAARKQGACVVQFAISGAWTLLMALAVVGVLWHTPLDDLGSILLSVGTVSAGAAIFEHVASRKATTGNGRAKVGRWG